MGGILGIFRKKWKWENFVIGIYHNQAHWNWITGANDKGSMIYNIRLDQKRDGSLKKTTIRNMRVKFAFLYEEGKEKYNVYHVFRVHDYAVMTEDRMRKAEYPGEPKGEYFIFRFDEEVTFGNIDIASLIEIRRPLMPSISMEPQSSKQERISFHIENKMDG